MSITVECGLCCKELDDLGGLLFSPPQGHNQVLKFHICRTCYYKILFPMLVNKEGRENNE